jgi:quercetin dioxygenase-like cupin family protein
MDFQVGKEASMKRAVFLLFLALAVGVTVGMLGNHTLIAQQGVKSTTVLEATAANTGEPIQFPSVRNQFVVELVEMAPGTTTGRHMHPAFHVIYVLEGELVDLDLRGGRDRTYKAGEAFVHAANTWEDVANRSTAPVKFLSVYATEKGKPMTVRP